MAFCTECGSKIAEGAKFCQGCGVKINDYEQPSNSDYHEAENVENFDGTDTTFEFDQKDIQQNKIMGIFAYIGLFVLIPLFGAPNSKFARFHANQGLILLIGEAIWIVTHAIINIVIMLMFGFLFSGILGFIPKLLSSLLGMFNIVFIVFAIIGIVNVATGKAKELPLIGKIRILK